MDCKGCVAILLGMKAGSLTVANRQSGYGGCG